MGGSCELLFFPEQQRKPCGTRNILCREESVKGEGPLSFTGLRGERDTDALCFVCEIMRAEKKRAKLRGNREAKISDNSTS
jgi:hypothetical protein